MLSPEVAPRAAVVILGIWLNAADGMVTATIMPSVARDLDAWPWFGWAIAVYLTGSILAGASAGQLSRRLGLRAALVAAAAVYALGCAASAAAHGMIAFLAGRALQGVGSGWIVGFCYVAIGVVFPERLWARMFGAGAAAWGVASLLGPLVGGLFAGAGHWRWAFSMFAAQGALFAIAAPLLLAGAGGGGVGQRLAWRTLAMLLAAISAVAAADIVEDPLFAVIALIAGLILLALAGRINAAPGERLLPAVAGRPWTVAGAGYGMIFAMSAATSVFGVYEAAFLQSLYGLSPLVAGYVIAAEALGWTAAALMISGQPEARQGAWIRRGATVIVAGAAGIAAFIATGPLIAVIAAGAAMGGGFGLAWSFVASRIIRALPENEKAIGSAGIPTAQLIGGAVGAAAGGAAANLLGLAHHFSRGQALAVAPWLFAAFLPLTGLGWLAAWRVTREPGSPVAPSPQARL